MVTSARIPTSLRNTPSTMTEAEARARAEQVMREFWVEHGLVIVNVHDDRQPWPLRESAAQHAEKRFGRRAG